MHLEPFRIQLHLLEGDREGACSLTHMNWTGECLAFPRESLKKITNHPAMARPGIYVLVGYEGEIPEIYIGEALNPADRIYTHDTQKLFWEQAFVVSGNNLNKAHIVWLEKHLLRKARETQRTCITNKNEGQRALDLSQGEIDDLKIFMDEALRILPVAGLNAFQPRKTIIKPVEEAAAPQPENHETEKDTLIVITDEENLHSTFIAEKSWWYVKVSKARMPHIKHIVAYVKAPIQAIKHIAEVDRFEPYKEGIKVIFKGEATKLPTPLHSTTGLFIRGTRYGTYAKLGTAKDIEDFMA